MLLSWACFSLVEKKNMWSQHFKTVLNISYMQSTPFYIWIYAFTCICRNTILYFLHLFHILCADVHVKFMCFFCDGQLCFLQCILLESGFEGHEVMKIISILPPCGHMMHDMDYIMVLNIIHIISAVLCRVK